MFTKNFMGVVGEGGGGNFHGEKLTPENASQKNCPPETCPTSSKEKKNKKENWLQKREEMMRKLIKTKSLHSPRKHASYETAPGKSRRKNPEKINP